MTAGLELSVTICSWNTCADTRACLDSLGALRQECAFEVIVVDNGSTDGSADMIAGEFPWVRLIRSEVNLGFTGGHNACLAQREGPDALVLNSDTVVHAGALRTLVDYSRAHPEVGIIGPKLLNPNGSLQFSCRRFPNPVAALFRNTFVGRLFPNNRWTRDYLMADWTHDEPRQVDWVSGAALYVTKHAIETVGVLDEAYFMYCEDVDWCFRAHRAGLDVTYLPTAVITHAIGTSSSKAANRMIVRFHRSMLRFYRKNMVPTLPLPVRPLAIAFAASALSGRAGLFIAKNWLDALVRWVRRS
ncbi:MAG TPA: glycosyltransferase family 2 protein [Fimbriimonadaceae bacterium]|nr:glycosyltransferase family 2 protein [Fimbriimonadaceae bacterium]